MSDAAVEYPSMDNWMPMVIEMLERDPDALKAKMPPQPTTDELVEQYPQLAGVEETDVAIPGPHGPVDVRLYRHPSIEPRAGFVWVHGGAFILGDLDVPEAHWVSLALASRGVPVLSVDYRKAVGKNRFPVPSDDVLAAWLWACDNAGRFGVAVDALHLGGGSAGGNLTAGVTKRLRDGAGALPASLVLAYPVVHSDSLEPSSELLAAFAARPDALRFPRETGEMINLQYAVDEAGLANTYAFAGNGDVSGQPPVYILNSEADDLRSSGELYARQLAAAGVTVRVEFEPGTQHGHLSQPETPEAWRSIDRILDWFGLDHSAAV